MRRLFRPSIALLLLAMTTTPATQQDPATLLTRARALHKQMPLIDGHNDYPWALRENAGRDLDKLDITQAAAVDHDRHPAAASRRRRRAVLVRLRSRRRQGTGHRHPRTDRHRAPHDARSIPDTFELALTADDVERIFKKGKIASLIGMEGGHSIDNSLGALRMFYRLGARYMTLTHSRNMPWADSATDTPVAERTLTRSASRSCAR